jgi:hypothetical protein
VYDVENDHHSPGNCMIKSPFPVIRSGLVNGTGSLKRVKRFGKKPVKKII